MALWRLNDPRVPTVTAASSIDKILLKPGGYMLSPFLPPDNFESGAHARVDDVFFPATVSSQHASSAHFPIALPIPRYAEEKPRKS